jgi:hypothetical protein
MASCRSYTDDSPGFTIPPLGSVTSLGGLDYRSTSGEALASLTGREPNFHVLFAIANGDGAWGTLSADWKDSKLQGPSVWPLEDYLSRVHGVADHGPLFGGELYTFNGTNGEFGAVVDIPTVGRVIFTGLQKQSSEQIVDFMKSLDLKALLGVVP